MKRHHAFIYAVAVRIDSARAPPNALLSFRLLSAQHRVIPVLEYAQQEVAKTPVVDVHHAIVFRL